MQDVQSQDTNLLYYYRQLKGTNFFKCAGHGAEDPRHRAWYEPFFAYCEDKDPRYQAGRVIIAPYQGDIIEG